MGRRGAEDDGSRGPCAFVRGADVPCRARGGRGVAAAGECGIYMFWASRTAGEGVGDSLPPFPVSPVGKPLVYIQYRVLDKKRGSCMLVRDNPIAWAGIVFRWVGWGEQERTMASANPAVSSRPCPRTVS